MSETGSNRIAAMDGLRGWAAVSVVIFHFTWEMFGTYYPVFRSYIPAFLGNGELAVAIFFTLSGYVLTYRRWREVNTTPLLLVLVRRYLRLTIPIIVACFIFWLLMTLKLTPTRAASAVIDNRFWLGHFADFTPSFLGMIQFALWRTYTFAPNGSYGPFLWTMIVELWGSLFVLSLSQSGRLFREPYTPLLLLAVLLMRFFPPAACLPLGAMIAVAQKDGVLFRNPPSRTESAIATVIVVACLLVAQFFILPTEQLSTRSAPRLWPMALIGVLVVCGSIRSAPITWLLTRPVSQALGRLSFPLYLIHASVVVTVGAWLILWCGQAGTLNEWTALLIAMAGILTSLAAAPLLLPVETLTLSFVRRFDWPWRRRAAAVPA